MKGLYTFFALLILASCYSISSHASSSDSEAIKQEVQNAFQGLVTAFENLDMEAYFSYFDKEKFSGLNADGKHWTSFDEIKANVEPSFATIAEVESLVYTTTHITIIDDNTVILLNQYKQRLLMKNGSITSDDGSGMQVWSQRKGRWQLVSLSAVSTQPQWH